MARWRAAVHDLVPEAVTLRHQLHGSPSLGGHETPTAQAVVDWIGLGDGDLVAGTGRLLRLARGAGTAIAVRAELDGLPVDEETGVAWASSNGAMHACGHDVHLAGLAAVVRAAAGLDLPRPLVALLQPREEGVDSGAKDIVDEGGLDGIEAVVAAHLQPRVDAGVIAVTPGPVNAAMDSFRVEVSGRGGHSGYPHTVDDSVLAMSAVVVALQQIGRPADRPDRRSGVHGEPGARRERRQRRADPSGVLRHRADDAPPGPRDRPPGDRRDRGVGGSGLRLPRRGDDRSRRAGAGQRRGAGRADRRDPDRARPRGGSRRSARSARTTSRRTASTCAG